MASWIIRRIKSRFFWKGRRLIFAAALPLIGGTALGGAGFVSLSDFLPDSAMKAFSTFTPVLAQPGESSTIVTGRVTRVRDADTVEVSGKAIRLNGVDAPELSTQAGRDGRTWPSRQVEGREVTCRLNGARTHDRAVGSCKLAGENIGAMVVQEGYALDCRRYS